jgi:uncharacterized membrane protein YphA (DoxX/SURF4 family)
MSGDPEGGVMALSEAEQELLAKLEASLSAEDPKLASKFARAPQRRVHPKRATLGVLGLLIGVALLVVGLSTTVWISVAGFVLMLVAAVFFLSAWQRPFGGGSPAGLKAAPSAPARAAFMDRLEQRWNDRLNGQ